MITEEIMTLVGELEFAIEVHGLSSTEGEQARAALRTSVEAQAAEIERMKSTFEADIVKAQQVLDTFAKERDTLRAENQRLRDALEALVSNEEHATSGGMRSYQVGSQTWELWEAARAALETTWQQGGTTASAKTTTPSSDAGSQTGLAQDNS